MSCTSVRSACGVGCGVGLPPLAEPSAIRRRNTGSLVYWAMPWPRRNGRKAGSRSRGRQPTIVVSSVSTIASQPHASARATRLSTSVVRRAPVELEPARAVAERGGALLHRARGLVGEDHRHPRVARGAGDRDVGLAVGELEHADRREQERRLEPAAEQLDRRVGLRGAAQHPRHDAAAGEGGAVLAHGVLRTGARGDVREGVGGQRLARGLLEAVGIGRDARAAPADPAEVDGCLALATDHGG